MGTRGGDDDMTQASDVEPAARPAAGGGGAKRPSILSRIALYNRQIVSEMRKVIWPTRNELVTYTIVSVVFVVFMIAFVGVLDYLFTKLVFQLFG
jgi:preprotein translocase subunit SecE